MAKARSLVGLDVHAAKIVAAVLDAETGQVQHFRMSGDVAEAAGLCAGLAGRCARLMRRGRRATDLRANLRAVRSIALSRRRARSLARAGTASD